ncbi:MAG: HAD family hydrolase [Candidatus Bathyarchaeota archaeon]|jgi:HAD superfamily hydrolase (TIGR01549 family)
MEQIKAITFDFGGTLAHGELDKEKYWKALIDYFREIGYSGGIAKINKARLAMLDRLRKTQAKNHELRFDMLCSGLMFDLGLYPTKERLKYIDNLYKHFFRINFIPGVKETLDDLSRRYNLSIISNAISNVSRLALKNLDFEIYFDYIILSHDLGIRKPDPEIFNFVLNSWGINGKEAVHVGDSLENDVQGGKNAGMKTVLIREKEEILNIHPDFIISKIAELTSIF